MGLNAFELADIYLGRSDDLDYCDIKLLPGSDSPRMEAPAEFLEELQQIRERCVALYRVTGRPEFRLVHEGTLYRVTCFDEAQPNSVNPYAVEQMASRFAAKTLSGADADLFIGNVRNMLDSATPAIETIPFFTISRVATRLVPIQRLALPRRIREAILSPNTRGLILFVGPMSSGKTSSGASSMSARLQTLSCEGLSLEDPIETLLDGLHGNGRCTQIEVSRTNGGYREALTRALRSRIGSIFVSEIRDEDTTEQVLRMASTDHFILSTMHAESVQAAVELLYTYAKKGVDNAASLIASGVTAIVYQRLIRSPSGEVSVEPTCLSFLDPTDRDALKSIIRAGEFDKIRSIQQEQQRRHMHAS
jgi:hypothetical protein